MSKYLTEDKNIILVLEQLKAHGIKRVIASPGATNRTIVSSMQYDGYFEMYSSVDERSAAYMACGMAAESGEPVVLSCTGATASRNYMSALTEAYYRKLPLLVITSSQNDAFQGHLYQQLTDRTHYPGDIFVEGVQLQFIDSDLDYWDCENKVNKAILALSKNGGGPVHINIQNGASNIKNVDYNNVRIVRRITYNDKFPTIDASKIGIVITSHNAFSVEETEMIDLFCSNHDAVVFCDHTSNYFGKYRVDYALIGVQKRHHFDLGNLDLLIHIGEMSGDIPTLKAIRGKQVWRISPDGDIRIRFQHLEYIFQMDEITFFRYYTSALKTNNKHSFWDACEQTYLSIYDKIGDIPFSNVWTAKEMSPKLPKNSVLHLGILSSLRSWNLFRTSKTIRTYCNVGGFGIDGCISTVIGASILHPDTLYFLNIGDLAFFYDMNALGNRHIGNNIRILLVNNGKGGEFKSSSYKPIPVDVDAYCAAGGHYGNQSPDLVRHLATDLGFEYLSASSKEEFFQVCDRFASPQTTEKPMLLEIFVKTEDQKAALDYIYSIAEPDATEFSSNVAKNAKNTIKDGISKFKSIFK